MKSIKDVASLLSTLEFLEHIGAGEPLREAPTVKTDLEITSAKKLFPKTLIPLEAPTAVNKDLPQPLTSPVKKRTVAPQLKKNQAHLEDAQKLASGATTLEDLKKAIQSFEGCTLKHTAMHTVFSDGNPNADVMLIGEAPGADEDRQGLPFVGGSGQLLDKMLYAIGKNRQTDYYISNVIPWRPPGNRPPTKEETALCLPFIERHIELKQPKVLIFVGATAAKTLLETKDSMSKLRGKWVDYRVGNMRIPATVLFHPSYLIRSPGQKKYAWEDLLKIKQALLSQDLSSLLP